MTDSTSQILVSEIKDDQSYCTRQDDGVSGMTVTALADFCGTGKPAITQLLNQISDSDPFTNELAECLKPFAGNDWRLFTSDPQGRVFIIDEVCHAVLEYYAFDARKYKGKQIAITNHRAIARAGMRVFIWSQTGYSPTSSISQAVITKAELSDAIATALTQALTPINQKLERIEQRLDTIPGVQPERPWILPPSTPPNEVPSDYLGVADGSWLSPEAYEHIRKESRKSLPWYLRNFS